jgi:molybdopterin-containing oxidoreductase family membrane subunit
MAYLLLAALSTPLVLSVHSVVSFDFATSVVPGWHTTIFPPYFVAGAIFGGFAMVLTIMIPARALYGLHDMITMKHIDNMSKIILLTGTIVGYAYLMELFIAFYSGAKYEGAAFLFRIDGPYWWAYYCMMGLNVLSPQIFWFKKCRENLWVVMAVAMCVNIGMWFERFVIIVTTLARMWLPGDWKTYSPSGVDVMTFIGTIGMFLALFLLFLRFLPCINIAEVKWTLKESDVHDEDKKAHPDDGIEVIEAYQYELHENPEGAAKEAGIESETLTAES